MSNVYDFYTPYIGQSNLGDKLSDKFLGTNKVNNLNSQNQYEYQKAINLNKYSWNVQGMLGAGINPLVATNQLGGVAQSQANGAINDTNLGYLGKVLDYLDPIRNIREMKDTMKDFVKCVLKYS